MFKSETTEEFWPLIIIFTKLITSKIFKKPSEFKSPDTTFPDTVKLKVFSAYSWFSGNTVSWISEDSISLWMGVKFKTDYSLGPIVILPFWLINWFSRLSEIKSKL